MLVATEPFTTLAEQAAGAFGLRAMRKVVLPHPVNTLGSAELAPLAQRALADMTRKLVVAP